MEEWLANHHNFFSIKTTSNYGIFDNQTATTLTLPIPKWSFKHFPEIEQKYSQISEGNGHKVVKNSYC